MEVIICIPLLLGVRTPYHNLRSRNLGHQRRRLRSDLGTNCALSSKTQKFETPVASSQAFRVSQTSSHNSQVPEVLLYQTPVSRTDGDQTGIDTYASLIEV